MTWPLFLDLALPALAQAQAPPTPSPEVELLKNQLEFILTINTVFLGFLGVVGGLLTWFFKSNLDDAKEMATRMVRQELSDHIEPLIKAEANNIQRTFRTEQIISNTVVDYYIPIPPTQDPLEYHLLQGRGFLDVRLWHPDRPPQGHFGSVLVIDFVNCSLLTLPELISPEGDVRKVGYEKRDQLVNNTIQGLIDLRIGRSVLVVYVRPGQGRIAAIDQLTQNFPEEVKYYSSANTPVALMGTVVDSAYVAYGDRQFAG
ncbi:MAG: hypothetical protein F6J95_024245 [Leptolyngbya sp. SIO1E4]|nr:hypothetical protein [Leptolyngbya sp. SIO1E4]